MTRDRPRRPRQHGTGRAARTIFIIEWLLDADMQRRPFRSVISARSINVGTGSGSGSFAAASGGASVTGMNRNGAELPLCGTSKTHPAQGRGFQAWLADVIARISDKPVSRLHELLPWEWNAATHQVKAA